MGRNQKIKQFLTSTYTFSFHPLYFCTETEIKKLSNTIKGEKKIVWLEKTKKNQITRRKDKKKKAYKRKHSYSSSLSFFWNLISLNSILFLVQLPNLNITTHIQSNINYLFFNFILFIWKKKHLQEKRKKKIDQI